MDGLTGDVSAVAVRVTPFVMFGSVVATILIYVRAAVSAYSGVVPGAYVSLLYLAPIGLMAAYLPLLASVIMTVVPNMTALVLMTISAASVMAFQSAVVAGDLRVVMVLAAVNLLLYVSAAYAQMGLSVEGARKSYARRAELARALSDATTRSR